MDSDRDTIVAPRQSPQPPVLQFTPPKRKKIIQDRGFLSPGLFSKDSTSCTYSKGLIFDKTDISGSEGS